MTAQASSSIAPSSTVAVQRSPWHSPVPYLFGGLAAMLGLVAFALLILACSYWKLSGDMENDANGERDLEAGNGDGDGDTKFNNQNKEPAVFEEKYLVIMAGQAKPTFLAISSRASLFGTCSCQSNSTLSTGKSSTSDVEMMEEKEKEESGHQVQVSNTENHETAD